jgi:hypothetical protein
MQELKPVSHTNKRQLECNIGGFGMMWANESTLADLPLYALPATHRIVPVDVLTIVESFVAAARDHYGVMNDEVCQSYSDPWKQAVIVSSILHAIIDKGPT